MQRVNGTTVCGVADEHRYGLLGFGSGDSPNSSVKGSLTPLGSDWAVVGASVSAAAGSPADERPIAKASAAVMTPTSPQLQIFAMSGKFRTAAPAHDFEPAGSHPSKNFHSGHRAEAGTMLAAMPLADHELAGPGEPSGKNAGGS
jgi:hypothetical protein